MGEADKNKVRWTFFPPNARSHLIGPEQADKKKVRWTFFPPNA